LTSSSWPRKFRGNLQSGIKHIGKDFLTVQEVAPKLGYTERTVLDLIRSNKLKATKVGGRWHINPLDLDEFKNGHPTPAKSIVSRGDIELGPHQRSLFFFGRCIRDYLSVDMPYIVIKHDQKEFTTALWQRKDTLAPPRNPEEKAVDVEWGYGDMDARQQSLFPYFQKHLESHSAGICLPKLNRHESNLSQQIVTQSKNLDSLEQKVQSNTALLEQAKSLAGLGFGPGETSGS
jgi:excisionase family DNA binding protein